MSELTAQERAAILHDQAFTDGDQSGLSRLEYVAAKILAARIMRAVISAPDMEDACEYALILAEMLLTNSHRRAAYDRNLAKKEKERDRLQQEKDTAPIEESGHILRPLVRYGEWFVSVSLADGRYINDEDYICFGPQPNRESALTEAREWIAANPAPPKPEAPPGDSEDDPVSF